VIDEFGGYYGVVNETPDMDAGFDEEGEDEFVRPDTGKQALSQCRGRECGC
jgi:hypothetical protein